MGNVRRAEIALPGIVHLATGLRLAIANAVRRVPVDRVAAAKAGANIFRRKKVCKFCVEKIEAINYKDVRLLAQFVAESGKIVPRRLTGVCTPHQRRLSLAIKQARNIALLPFAGRAS